MKTRKKIFLAGGLLLAIILVVAALFFMPRKTARRSFAATYDTSGLGMGIDVAAATEVNEFKTTYLIFDLSKIQELDAGEVRTNKSEAVAHSTTNVTTLANELGSSAEASVGVTFPLGAVGAGLSVSGNLEYNTYAYKYYYMLDHKVERFQRYLFNSNEQSTYAECYTPEFLRDLESLKNGNLSYENFFKRYGTHVVGKAIYGGRLNAVYCVATNEVAIEPSMEAELKAKAGLGFTDDLKAELTGAINSKLSMSFTQSDIETEFNVRAWGGSAVRGDSFEGFTIGYDKWCDSFNNDSQSVVIDYPEDGLIPIWELLPSDYAYLSSAMSDGFDEYYNDVAENVLEQFKSLHMNENYVGDGSEKNPYLIRSQADLTNIKNGMDKHYALANDITLSGSDWSPIGGVEKTNSFTGTLNGRGYKIKNLTEVVTYEKKADEIPINGGSRRIYFGLFGDIGRGAIIKNLGFGDVHVSIQGPAVNNSSTRVVIGVLAATFSGKAQNVRVISGSCSYDKCTNGSSIVGGIAGLSIGATFTNCENRAILFSGRYSAYTGGISGYARECAFTNCVNYGALTAKCTGFSGNGYCGGIVGMAPAETSNSFFDCSNKGTLSTATYANNHAGEHRGTKDLCAKTNGPKLDY